jgi:hypothetical protein
MDRLDPFVPGLSVPPPARGIGAYLPAMPEGVASAYVAALTRPGDLVLDPFCQTGRVLRESVALGRRALGSNFNPIAARWIDSQLWPPDPALVVAAFVRLGDARRADTTLRQHAQSLYSTRCPTCGKSAVAEWFAWEREGGPTPTAKHVRCAACKTDSTGPADVADVAAAGRFEPRGMAFHFMLERAAPDEPNERERAAAVVEAYTARALSALAEILRKVAAASEADQAALRLLLLTAFEAALSLHPAEEERPRPRSLKVPPRFIERNPWLAMQDALPARDARLPGGESLPRSPDAPALIASPDPAASLVARGGRELGKLIPPGSVRLILAVPPQPDPTFWALSAVWAGWLWGHSSRGVESLKPLLARRRADVDWLWRGIAQALGALLPALAEDGHVALVSSETGEDALTGLLLAGAGIGLGLDHALVEPQRGLRVLWHPAPRAPIRELDADALATEIGERARRAAGEILRARGEPAPWPFVHAAIQSEIEQAGLLRIAARMPEDGTLPIDLIEQATLDALRSRRSPVYPVEDVRGPWWLTDPGQVEPPLSDRVEAFVQERLTPNRPECLESDLTAEVYRRFPGPLTPERAFIRLCLESYALERQPGVWALREEDTPFLRQSEIASLLAELMALGERLGCEAAQPEGRVTWSKERRLLFTFTPSPTAQLGAHLLAIRPPRGQPVLVLPGGRGALAHYRLRRDARLRDAVSGAGWTFLKFRQLRSLVAQPGLTIVAFRDELGRDPLIEKEGQQMALL